MSKSEQKIFEIANGDIDVWLDESGVIFLKVRTKFDDPVELGNVIFLHSHIYCSILSTSSIRPTKRRREIVARV